MDEWINMWTLYDAYPVCFQDQTDSIEGEYRWRMSLCPHSLCTQMNITSI